MTEPGPIGTTPVRLIDRILVRWRALRIRPTALVSHPEPRMIGQYARGRQMLAGNFLMAGELIEAQGRVPFSAESAEAVDALHSFEWLDHLAVLGDAPARALAQSGVLDWISRFGRGAGPGWVPGLAGQRVIRMIGHALFLLQGMPAPDQARFLHSIGLHADYLSRRAGRAEAGLPRIAAQVGQLYAALALEGLSGNVPFVTQQMVSTSAVLIEADGGLPTRNPEELLAVFELLSWAAQALADQGKPPPAELLAQLDRIAAALRVLRHADGGLARFHGGGRGAEGALAEALATHDRLVTQRLGAVGDRAMGFVRLAAGRCTVIIDAAPPPIRAAARRAHASTLAFELTSNRRPLIVSCGDGRVFGPDWHRASRATASHSTLAFEGYSSSRFAARSKGRPELAEGPRHVGVELRHAPHARAVALSHDGYLASHGLEHLRYLDLSADGRVLSGADTLVATSAADKRRFRDVLKRSGRAGVPFALRFHLHPEAEASLDMNATAVSVVLRSGEVWVFRAEGLRLDLAASVYLEKGRLKPRPSQQIVLSLRALEDTTQINWSMAKAQETPTALRDLEELNPLAVPQL